MFLIAWLIMASAWAHPFGSTLYGHKTNAALYADRVELEYLLEIPTPELLRELRAFMADIESPTQRDQDRHTEAVQSELTDGLRLLVNGERLPWVRTPCADGSGQGDTRFISYRFCARAAMPEGARTLNLINGNRPDEPALFSTTVMVGAGVVLDASSQIDVDHHGTIVADRSESWRGEETERELRLSFRLRTAVGAALQRGVQRAGDGELTASNRALSTAEPDVLSDLVKGELTPKAVWFALFMALILGAAHAFAPGHGKALVAAYLLGQRRTYRHAFMLGGIVTATHTATVFALGGIALLLSEVLPTEHILPWMELASGLLVLGVGLQLVRHRALQADAPPSAHAHSHDHNHNHNHNHDHDHDHDHDHPHDHLPGDESAHAAAHAKEIASVRAPRDLIALGISGGLAPCPSALVLLLTAISFHRIAFGLVLVTVFSVGLAAVVTGVAVTVIAVGGRIRNQVNSRFVTRTLPVMSAVVVTILGLGLTVAGVHAVHAMLEVSG